MQIFKEQIAQETRVDSATSLVQDLKTNHGVKDPKIILVFDSNEDCPDEAEHPWKVHVFYNSPTPLEHADLSVPMVLKDTKLWPQGEEVIRTVYPEGNIGWCGKINGKRVWIT